MIYLQTLTILCSLAGAGISIYFILATYRIIPGNGVASLPVSKESESRKRIVDTRFGRILYIPNSIYGAGYYLAILILTLGWWNQWSTQILFWISILSGAVVLFSIFLYFALTKKLDSKCPLCITTHLINVILFVIFVIRTMIYANSM